MSNYYMYAQGQHYQQPQQSQATMIRPTKPEDWEPYREIIAEMYNTLNMRLKDVMTQMQIAYNFKATEKQYKTQLKKWNLDTKYIKASEYLYMIKTLRERKAIDPNKETRFILRGKVVDPKDIARFEKRAIKKGLLKEGEPIHVDDEPIEEITCCTPPPEGMDSYPVWQTGDYDGYDPSSEYPYSY